LNANLWREINILSVIYQLVSLRVYGDLRKAFSRRTFIHHRLKS